MKGKKKELVERLQKVSHAIIELSRYATVNGFAPELQAFSEYIANSDNVRDHCRDVEVELDGISTALHSFCRYLEGRGVYDLGLGPRIAELRAKRKRAARKRSRG
jgi:hypothetical protein